jgi:pyridinium-3,5-biscarboxylic acid mononucleotide sulfurtransferase
VAYGQDVTPERLAMIDQGEQFLRAQGFAIVRVRYHEGDLARIEVPLSELPRLAEPQMREAVTRRLQELGFRCVTLDLSGFRSGSLNAFVAVGTLMGQTGPPHSSDRTTNQ